MDIGDVKSKLVKKRAQSKQHLHSENHVLADELTQKLRDPKHFGMYLKIAISMDHAVIRKILGQVLESRNVSSPGKLFSFLIKKHNQENK